MDGFFRWFLALKWNIRGQEVRFLDGLMLLAMTGSGLIMRLVLMGGLTGWYGLLDYGAALLAAGIVYRGTKSLVKSFGVYAVCLITPTVLLAGSYWQKPEMAYVTLCLAALWCIAGRKAAAAAVCYGLAVLMNVQAVFLLPLFAVLWFYRTVGDGAFFTACLFTAVRLAFGKNAEQLLFGYGNEAAASRVLQGISDSAEVWKAWELDPAAVAPAAESLGGGRMPLTDQWPNIYAFFGEWDFLEEYAAGGLLFAAAVVLFVLVWLFLSSNRTADGQGRLVLGKTAAELPAGRQPQENAGQRLSGEGAGVLPLEYIVELGVFFSILLPFFLPHMNARAGLLAEVLAVILGFLNVRKAFIAPVHLILSFSMYQRCLTGIYRYPLAAYAAGLLALLTAAGVQVYRDTQRIGRRESAVRNR